MAEVVWTEAALSQVRKILEYVAADSESRAEKLGTRLLAARTYLPIRLCWVVAFPNITETISANCFPCGLTEYLTKGEICHVVGVIHSKRDFRKAMQEEQIDEI